MRFLKQTLLFISITMVLSCNSEGDSPNVDDPPVNIYLNCCATAPVEMDFNPGKVYIPNIFTPNNDGINDIFYVQADEGVEEVEVFRIIDGEENVIFEQFNILPNSIVKGWYPYENAAMNAVNEGLFNYYVKVRNTNGDVFEINGSVCSFVCDESNPFDNFDNCGFAGQNDGQGGFDPFLPDNEEDCP